MTTQNHTFRDGITRPAHKHPNGGGWVADAATVSQDAHIGPNAEVIGGTIYDGTIWGGTIRGGTIYDGTIRGGTIRGGTVTRDVTFICGAVPHPVTITDDHCGVGCQWHTHEHWFAHGAEIMRANRQRPEMLALLLQFIKLHRGEYPTAQPTTEE